MVSNQVRPGRRNGLQLSPNDHPRSMPDEPARHRHPQAPGRPRTHLTAATTSSPATRDRLATEEGQITVAESVVQKIAGKACREIAGVTHGHQRGPRVRLDP